MNLSKPERRTVATMAGVIAVLHVVGWTSLFVLIAQHAHGNHAFTLGIGTTAYTLGLRHAFDADHIAAIDNTTRKLINDDKRPLPVGFFFALGHSTVVFVLALLVAIGFTRVAGDIQNSDSVLHSVAGNIGTIVSGTFLYFIAAVNFVVLIKIVKMLRGARQGRFNEHELESHLRSRGAMNRVFSRATNAISNSKQMFPLGALFGLGFDTATEVALLFLAVGSTHSGLPWYSVLTFPVLFAAGMTLLDSINGCFMNFTYGWAVARPTRKVRYNVAITALSVVFALGVGTAELAAR